MQQKVFSDWFLALPLVIDIFAQVQKCETVECTLNVCIKKPCWFSAVHYFIGVGTSYLIKQYLWPYPYEHDRIYCKIAWILDILSTLLLFAVTCENVFSGIDGQRRHRSDCASAQSDLCHRCPLIELLHTKECNNSEQLPGWDYAQARNWTWLCRFCASSKTQLRLARPVSHPVLLQFH